MPGASRHDSTNLSQIQSWHIIIAPLSPIVHDPWATGVHLQLLQTISCMLPPLYTRTPISSLCWMTAFSGMAGACGMALGATKKKPRNWQLRGCSWSKERGNRNINIPSPHPLWENSEHSHGLFRGLDQVTPAGAFSFILGLLLFSSPCLTFHILSLVLPGISSQINQVAKSLFQDVLLAGLNPKDPYSLHSCQRSMKVVRKKEIFTKKKSMKNDYTYLS